VLDEVDEFYLGAAGREQRFPARDPREYESEEHMVCGAEHPDGHVLGVEVPRAQVHAVDASLEGFDEEDLIEDDNLSDEEWLVNELLRHNGNEVIIR
jgi:hypothetical protein